MLNQFPSCLLRIHILLVLVVGRDPSATLTGYEYVVFLDECGWLWGFELKVTKCCKSLMGQVSRSLEDSTESCVDFGGPFRGFGGEQYLQLG